ncbi:hypothetical protein [Spirosoma endbachense]|uniref:Uncharacterized protein n=1 Tax=Spirosoma endbachense TaxID=2666025 RepID=A0A6P1VSM1_9BACT|nr:hypothetical protein [Spirosoma endbachense]QHV94619.1 hypothetical protein GJR95_06155 [Spirosoma endbachense]
MRTSRQQVEKLIQQATNIPTLVVSIYNQYPEFSQVLNVCFVQRKERINANQFSNQSNK